jgi:hypothetical protein
VLAGTDNVSDAVQPVWDVTGLGRSALNLENETKHSNINEIDIMYDEKVDPVPALFCGIPFADRGSSVAKTSLEMRGAYAYRI